MRVLIDCRYVREGGRDGISRFTIGLTTALAERVDVGLLVSDPVQLEALPALPALNGPNQVGPLEPLTAARLRRQSADILFSPMQTIGTAGRAFPIVTTVHDLIYYRYPEPPPFLPAPVRLGWRLYHRSFWPQRMLLRGADGIVTVSRTTEGLLHEHGLAVRPTCVVPNAAARLADPVGVSPAAKRLVYMGSYAPYKNVETLVRAAALLPDYELVLAGRIDDREHDRLRALAPDARVTFAGGVSDAEYGELLHGSTALVHASLDEGFGIPVLEAMNIGLPVVVSDIPIFREVAGDAGLFADPRDPAAFAARVRELEQPGIWQAQSQRALSKAAEYSWERSAETLEAFLAETIDRWRVR